MDETKKHMAGTRGINTDSSSDPAVPATIFTEDEKMIKHTNTEIKNVTVVVTTKLEKTDETQWYSLTGTDYGTGCKFDNDIFGICDDGTIVDCENCPLTDGDWETIAVDNSITEI